MRLIDAYTAISLIQEDKIEGETLDIIRALGDGLQAETLNQACDRHIKIIKSLPTIEAKPKRGRWSEKHYCSNLTGYDYAVICSECEKPTYRQFAEPTPNYCPNCGADMRGRYDD